MVPPQARFYLRLDTGERAGEEVPIPADGLTVGRRPENALQLAESSVSGRHAALAVESGGVTLRDLGSTNGTKVGEERVEEHRLAHGDVVTFGNLRCSFVDTTMTDAAPSALPAAVPAGAPAAAPAPHPAGTAGADVGDAVTTVTSDRVAKSKSKGIWTLVLVLVLLGVAAGVALQMLGGGEETAVAGAPVPEVEGNLLDDASFESEGPLAWEDADAAPVAFYRDASFRSSGATGLGADLAAGEWARVRSPEFSVRQRRSYTLRAELGAEGSASACIGVEFQGEAGTAPFVAWGAPVSDLATVELTLDGMPGYSSARLLVEGRSEGGDGSVSLDDVSIVEESAGAGATASHEEYGVHLFGPASRSGALLRAGTVLLGGIRVRSSAADGLPRWPAATLAASSTGNGIAFTVDGAPSACELVMTVHTEGGGDEADLGWLATTGPDGFRAHSSAFEDVLATGMLLGQGVDLIRFGFAQPVRASALRTETGVRLVFASQSGLPGFDLQLAFGQERGEARTLAGTAADLERRGDSGAALAAWSDLLDRYPFDAALVEQASAARSRLLSTGHDRIHAVRQELERARFFDLGDLYRLCRAQAVEIGASFGDSEVAEAAATLVAEIDAELATFDQASGATRDGRLRAILGIVEGKEWGGVAGRVRAALGDSNGDGSNGDGSNSAGNR